MVGIIFASGTHEKIMSAIEQGVLTYPSYAFITDENKLAFLDKDSVLHFVVGDNPDYIDEINGLQIDVEELKKKVELLESPAEDIVIEIVDEVIDERLDTKVEEYIQPIAEDKILNLF